jgi:hypothetical protein
MSVHLLTTSFCRSDEDARQVRLVEKYNDGPNYSTDESDANICIALHDVAMMFFKDILSKASQDSDLAQLLKDRFCQHRTAIKPVAIQFKGYSEQYLKVRHPSVKLWN